MTTLEQENYRKAVKYIMEEKEKCTLIDVCVEIHHKKSLNKFVLYIVVQSDDISESDFTISLYEDNEDYYVKKLAEEILNNLKLESCGLGWVINDYIIQTSEV